MGVRVGGDAAEDGEEPPSGLAAQEEIDDIAQEKRGDGGNDGGSNREFTEGGQGSGGEQGNGSRNGEPKSFEKADGEKESGAVAGQTVDPVIHDSNIRTNRSDPTSLCMGGTVSKSTV